MEEVKYAPQIHRMAHALKDRCDITSPGDIALIEELFQLLSAIEPCDEDGRRSLWVSAERGPIEAFGNFETYCDLGEVNSYNEFIDLWKWYYPDEFYWYNVIALRRDDYTCILLNREVVCEIDPCHTRPSPFGFEPAPLIRWIIHSCQRAIGMLHAGTYNDFVRNNLPARHRTGTIKRSDLWAIFPEVKAQDIEGLSSQEIELFLRIIDGTDGLASPSDHIKAMTAQLFFKACALGYAANGFEGTDLSPSNQYIKHADGRDDGLSDLLTDSPEAFHIWYHDKQRGGGHPWEVIRGGNSTHVDLYIQEDDNGYYFNVAGDHRRGEAIRFFLAIHQAGLPVTIRHGKMIAEVLRGEDIIGIVPQGIIPRYCDWLFPGQQILDYMRPTDDEIEKMKDVVSWQSIREVRLIQAGGRGE